MTIEEHPLEPFLPEKAKILFLGSFPPPKARWSMEFFYPNWINDFWRIQGLIHFADKHYFEATTGSTEENSPMKRFDKEKIISFCEKECLAFFDTARKVCRLKDNADDNFLEVVEDTDILALLQQIPSCHTTVTTGGKASEELQTYFEKQDIHVNIPKVGESVQITIPHTQHPTSLTWWRMPSTSRAYPMKLEKKAEYYKRLIQ